MSEWKLWTLDLIRALALVTMFLSIFPAMMIGQVFGIFVGLLAWPFIAALGLVIATIADTMASKEWNR